MRSGGGLNVSLLMETWWDGHHWWIEAQYCGREICHRSLPNIPDLKNMALLYMLYKALLKEVGWLVMRWSRKLPLLYVAIADLATPASHMRITKLDLFWKSFFRGLSQWIMSDYEGLISSNIFFWPSRDQGNSDATCQKTQASAGKKNTSNRRTCRNSVSEGRRRCSRLWPKSCFLVILPGLHGLMFGFLWMVNTRDAVCLYFCTSPRPWRWVSAIPNVSCMLEFG